MCCGCLPKLGISQSPAGFQARVGNRNAPLFRWLQVGDVFFLSMIVHSFLRLDSRENEIWGEGYKYRRAYGTGGSTLRRRAAGRGGAEAGKPNAHKPEIASRVESSIDRSEQGALPRRGWRGHRREGAAGRRGWCTRGAAQQGGAVKGR